MGWIPWISVTWLTQPNPVVLDEIFLVQVLLCSMLTLHSWAVWG